MMRFSRWTILAMAVVLVSTSSADAFGRRGRRGCNGCNGGGCHGGVAYSGCHGGGGCCHSSHGTAYANGRTVYYGRTYSGMQRDSFYSQSEPVPPPVRSVSSDGVNYGTIDFRAPAGAQVWVDGQLVERRGDSWRWTSPALTGRRNYEVKASWIEDGRTVNRNRSVSVDAGGRINFDFTRPQGSEFTPATIDRPLDTAPGASTPPRPNTTPNTQPKTNPKSNPVQQQQ
jgi:uncharacterized protein (TIGR03000 family)